jgi:hypothetical protein
MKYSIKNLRQEFGIDAKCLQFVFDNRYGKEFVCPQCKATGKFYLIESRKRFDCVCGFTVSPLAYTFIKKSSTPLTKWLETIYLVSNGINITNLQKEIGVTWKCASRMWNVVSKKIQSGIIIEWNVKSAERKKQIINFIFNGENQDNPAKSAQEKMEKGVITPITNSVPEN